MHAPWHRSDGWLAYRCEVEATVLAEVFEDNQGCLALATNHRLTSRTKCFHVKWHWFWYFYKYIEN
jgi:hypothetical protein